MTQEGWKQLIINAVRHMDKGENLSIELLSKYLKEIDLAKQTLREIGYGCTGMSLLETIRRITNK